MQRPAALATPRMCRADTGSEVVGMDQQATTVGDMDRLHNEASSAVYQAQREYLEIEDHEPADRQLWAAAWLRLWRAEERLREIMRTMDHTESA